MEISTEELLKKLKENPKDPFLWTRLSYDYYYQEKYDEALKAGQKAYDLLPVHPVIMWDYARALYMNRRFKESFKLLNNILKKDIEFIAEYMKNKHMAEVFTNRCRYDLALCYIQFNKLQLALKLLQKIIRDKVLTKNTCDSIDMVKERYKRALDTQKEILSKKPKVWISLLDVEKIGGYRKGFTNGLAVAVSSKKAIQYLKEYLQSNGYILVKAEDAEPYKRRILKSVVSDELRTLADSLKKEGDVAFGDYRMYKTSSGL